MAQLISQCTEPIGVSLNKPADLLVESWFEVLVHLIIQRYGFNRYRSFPDYLERLNGTKDKPVVSSQYLQAPTTWCAPVRLVGKQDTTVCPASTGEHRGVWMPSEATRRITMHVYWRASEIKRKVNNMS